MGVKPIKEVVFDYADISKTIEKQANEQGYTLGDRAQYLEGNRHIINKCKWNFISTRKQCENMIKRLNKAVMRSLKPLESEL